MSIKKCERCGQTKKNMNTIFCKPCKKTHLLCEICIDTYQFLYFCESSTCFLKEPVLGERKEEINMPRGGKRKGAGRKPGSIKKNNKAMLSVRIDSKLRAWLKKQKNQTRVVEKALQNYKKKESNNIIN